MNAQIFIDAENIRPELGFRAIEKFSRDYSIKRVDIIGKEEIMPARYKNATAPCRVQNCFYGKNIADTWLCVEIAKTIYENSDVEVIIIVSDDRDFLPAIKLAADKNKQVIFVSNGAGHRNLERLLRELRINLDSVQLIDYHIDLNFSTDTGEHRRKKSLAELMKDVKPTVENPKMQKLDSFCLRLSDHEARFFKNREEQVRFIFIKRGDNFLEVPFVSGMTVLRFTAVLRELRVIGKKVSGVQAAKENFLKVIGDKVCFYREEEIQDLKRDILSDFPKLSKASKKYFTDHHDKLTTVFIKHAGQLNEVPFVNGIEVATFSIVLRELKAVSKKSGFQKIMDASLLDVKNNRVYLRGEDELDQEVVTEKVAEKFFSEHKKRTKKIFIRHNQQLHEVNFVNGMEIPMFGASLREAGIIGKNASILKIIENSLLCMKDNRVFLPDEEDLALMAESEETDEKFFDEHKGDVKNIFVQHGGKIYEVPFVNGMRQGIFFGVLKNRGIVEKIAQVPPIIRDSFLNLIDGQVFFRSEEEYF